jgi:hypothetical protein
LLKRSDRNESIDERAAAAVEERPPGSEAETKAKKAEKPVWAWFKGFDE